MMCNMLCPLHSTTMCLLHRCLTPSFVLRYQRRRSLTVGIPSARKQVFDRAVKCLQRERAARDAEVGVYDYLRDEVGWRVADRLFDIKRTFSHALELGCGRGHVIKHLDREIVQNITVSDMSKGHLEAVEVPEGVHVTPLHQDEESVEMPADSVQLVVSSLSLHWINDLETVLRNSLTALQKDCPIVGACLGGNTLHQLRTCLQLADLERCGGVRPHMSPLLRPVDVTALLSRTGYAMITVDVDPITVRYPSMFELLWDLQGMAENAAPAGIDVKIGRDCLLAAAAIYREMYSDDADGVPATFDVIHFIGWKPSPDQPKPAARGSAQVSFKDLASVVTEGPKR